MIRRPRRSVPATAVALVILLVGVAVVVALVQSWLGRTPFLTLAQLVSVSGGQRWSSAATITVAIVGGLVGLVLLVVALRPGKPTVLPVARLTDSDGSPDLGCRGPQPDPRRRPWRPPGLMRSRRGRLFLPTDLPPGPGRPARGGPAPTPSNAEAACRSQ